MKIYLYEIYKLLYSKKLILLLIFLCCINAFLCYQDSSKEYIKPKAYKSFYSDIAQIDEDDLYNYLNEKEKEYSIYDDMIIWGMNDVIDRYGEDALVYIEKYNRGENLLKYTSQITTEHFLYQEALQQLNAINQYGEYLDDIEIRAEQMLAVSIYAKKGTFAYKNITLTPKAYAHLKENTLKFGTSKGVDFATNRKATDIIALLSVFFISSNLIMTEKDKRLFELIRTTLKGRLSVITSKIAASMTFCFVLFFMLYGGNILISDYLYGIGDLSRKIQSIQGFMGCTLDVTVSEYIFIFALVKLLTYFLFSFIILYICITAKSSVTVYSCTSVILAISALLYSVVPGTSVFSLFKYINIFSFLNTNGILSDYFNINVFNIPVNIIGCTIISLIVGNLVFSLLSAYVFSIQRNSIWGVSNLYNFIKLIFPVENKITTSIFAHEAYKILIKDKGLFVILAVIIFGIYNYNEYRMPFIQYDDIYKSYMTKIQGEINQSTDDFIAQERDKFNEIRSRQNQVTQEYYKGTLTSSEFSLAYFHLQRKLEPEIILDKIDSMIYDIQSDKNEKIRPWLLYDTGYNQLTDITENPGNTISMLILIVSLIACVSPVYANDNAIGAMHIIMSTRNGREISFMYRIIVCSIITFILFIASYLPNLVNILLSYGTQGIDAPIQSLSAFRNFPVRLNILQYLITMYLLKLLFAEIIMLVLLCISYFFNSSMNAILLGTGIFVLPIILVIFRADFMRNLLYNPFISVNVFFKDNKSFFASATLLVNAILMMVFVISLFRSVYRRVVRTLN